MHIIRSILVLFRRFSLLMTLNVSGLVIAFCAFFAIMGMVDYENSYDSSYPESECIFRVDQTEADGVFRSVLPPGFADAVAHGSPHIVAGALWCPFSGEQYIVVTDDMGQEHGFKLEMNNVTSGILDVFGIETVEGDRHALEEPDKVAIPLSIARKLFGNSPAVGKHLEVRSASGFVSETDWTVGVVYRDVPENSQMRNNILVPLPDFFLQIFGASNFLCYLRLDSPSSAAQVASDFNSSFDFSHFPNLSKVTLTPVRDIYYLEEGSDSRIFRSGSKARTDILVAVAILILLVGTFNFTDFYAALVPSRLRSINTMKVFGASGKRVSCGILLETAFLSLGAFVLACLIMYFVFPASVSPRVLALSFCAALLCGVLSGVYPGLFATSFQPAAVLRGGHGIPAAGRVLKTCLLVLQLAVCMAMLSFVVFTHFQNRMMMTIDTGFDKDRLAVVDLPVSMVQSGGESFRNEVMNFAGVEDVAFASEIIGSQETYMTESLEWRGTEFGAFLVYCSGNFLSTAGIRMVEGDTLTLNDVGKIVMNEDARKKYGLQTGPFPGLEIWALDGRSAELAGFCDNVRFSSMRHEAMPLCFCTLPPESGYYSVAYVRMSDGADRQAVADHIKDVVSGIDPAYPCEVLFYDGILQDLYSRDLTFGRTVTLFSVLAMVLALLGAFSMVMFDSQYSRREYALRRVYGSSVSAAVAMMDRKYALLTLLACIFSVPLSWIAVRMWLDRFVIRVGISWWVFAASFAVVLVLTLATVSYVSFRSVRANPASVLREE